MYLIYSTNIQSSIVKDNLDAFDKTDACSVLTELEKKLEVAKAKCVILEDFHHNDLTEEICFVKKVGVKTPLVVFFNNHQNLEKARLYGYYGADLITNSTTLKQDLNKMLQKDEPMDHRVKLQDFGITDIYKYQLITIKALRSIEMHFSRIITNEDLEKHTGYDINSILLSLRKDNLLTPKKILNLFKVKQVLDLKIKYNFTYKKASELVGFSSEIRFFEAFGRIFDSTPNSLVKQLQTTNEPINWYGIM